MEQKIKKSWRTPSVVLWLFSAIMLSVGIGAVSSIMGGVCCLGVSFAVVTIVHGIIRAFHEAEDKKNEREMEAEAHRAKVSHEYEMSADEARRGR